MAETCKTCKRESDSGIWLSPQFADEKVFLFCSVDCKNKFIKEKLERLKVSYPKYYEMVMKGEEKWWNKAMEKGDSNKENE